MLTPLDSISFSMYSNPGVYALLIGSGVSRSAGIPTGWEVTLDLIRKLAAGRGLSVRSNSEDWYREETGDEPDYSKLLKALARSPTERQQLLRPYFEPTEEEREQEIKVPQEAHEAIASLVELGIVRFVITTNFDRLIETALENRGLEPTVISSASQADGALPLVHQRCLVLKLHGDYRDPLIKNTESELAKYPPKLKKLLSEILESCGLVVCGWSAEYDLALREAIEKVKSRRFPVYWAAKGGLSDAARRLSTHRAGVVFQIENGDVFFGELAQRIESLREFDRPHPLSVGAAVATLKRFLADERHRIRLHDLITGETDKVCSEISDESRFSLNQHPTVEEFGARIKAYQSVGAVIEALVATGCYFGDDSSNTLWVKCIERLINSKTRAGQSYNVWRELRLYPALRLLYVSGISALAGERLGLLYALLNNPVLRDQQGTSRRHITYRLNALSVLDERMLNSLNRTRLKLPASEYLFDTLREVLRVCLSDDQDYEARFNQFEYILACNFLSESDESWMPPGRFAYKVGTANIFGGHELEQVFESLEPPIPQALEAGFFDGSRATYEAKRAILIEQSHRFSY